MQQRKLSIIITLILVISLLVGCGSSVIESVEASGDLAYYADMDMDTIKDQYKGKYIEVTGKVSSVSYTLVYLEDEAIENIKFSCTFADSDEVKDKIQQGDIITVRGKCSSAYGNTVTLRECQLWEGNTATTEEKQTETTGESITTTNGDTVTNSEEGEENNITVPVHVHSFSEADCTTPKTCSCGATDGKANGHSWIDATCSEPKTCSVCGTTSGLTAGHNFSKGKCTTCGKADPDYVSETMVWIPTKGGTKYHSRSNCSNMDDPEQVTQSEAERRGFTPCKRCH